jgi:hypothetical protein
MSVIAYFSTGGHFLPPVRIFKLANKKQEFEDTSAYVSSDVFMTWLKDHFLPTKPSGNIQSMDVHHTSVTLAFWT